jgi:hypothetical protein
VGHVTAVERDQQPRMSPTAAAAGAGASSFAARAGPEETFICTCARTPSHSGAITSVAEFSGGQDQPSEP